MNGTNEKLISDFSRKRNLILRRRAKQLEALRDLRGEKCTDACRDLLILAAYSSFVPVFGKDKARALTVEFNAAFSDPLPSWELEGILYRTECKERLDRRGYYAFRAETLARFLHVTNEEAAAVGLLSKKALARAEAGARREAKENRVRELLTSEERLTYREISERMTAEGIRICEKTVQNIARKLGLSRYRKDRSEEPAAVAEICEGTAAGKTAKNCQKSFSESNIPSFSISLKASENENKRITEEKHPGRQGKPFRDVRFEIISEFEEFRGADPAVLGILRDAFSQARRLKRGTFLVNGREVPTAEIMAAFDGMTYKAIFVLACHLQEARTIYTAEKPFFYVLQSVWNCRHEEDAAVCRERTSERYRTDRHRRAEAKAGHSSDRHTDYDALVFEELFGAPA